MKAAVVRSFGTPPAYGDFATPEPGGPHDVLVTVEAAGLHPRVRSSADGSHYTSDGTLPLVPGIDGVGRTAEGELLYFVRPDTALGSMAERAVADRRRTVTLPDGTDPVAVAAAMNPGMSSWIGLRRRGFDVAGKDVLVFGATGNAGLLAVQVAKHLGAAHVTGAGRDPRRLALLPSLGADAAIGLDEVAKAADVDVVLDYLWGPPAEHALPALLTARDDRSKALAWVQIGSVAGPDVALPSYLLRAANVSIMGSGQGSVPTAGIVAELPALAAQIAAGAFAVNPVAVPLADVTAAWAAPVEPGRRIVLVP